MNKIGKYIKHGCLEKYHVTDIKHGVCKSIMSLI